MAPDLREVSRVVATVLLASGSPSAEDVARANGTLARLGLPALAQHDAAPANPEELARAVPAEVRAFVAHALFDLAGHDPLRRRLAQSYDALWGGREPARPAAPQAGPVALRWLVGKLPRHHLTSISEEEGMTSSMASTYRDRPPQTLVAPSAHGDPMRARVDRIRAEFLTVVAAVERALIGKRPVVERAITALAARGHVLLVDAPGVGKTLLCKAVAAACGVRFGRIQFTPDLLPLDLTGASIYQPHDERFVFRPGPLFTQFLLADEINRATPKTQSALLEVMEERTVTVDGTTYPMAEPFQVLATMNPVEHEGTFPLPAAQIDRFMMTLELGVPTADDEVRVLDTHLSPDPVLASIEPVLSSERLVEWQRTVPHVHAAPAVKRAAVDYVQALRRGAHPGSAVSPRATLAWMRAAQAHAMLSGREFVIVEDLLEVSGDVLRHRLWLAPGEVRDRLRALGPSAAGT
jgi:MoxR-like ATPase